MHEHGREGAKQPRRFDPARAARLDDPARFGWLPVADVVALLDVPHRGVLVDFGAGTGTYAIEIALVRPDVRIVALDEQPEMLDLLRAKLEVAFVGNVEPAGSDALPAWRGRADRVLGINVLHELGDAALKDLRKLLKDDGKVVFIDWNSEVERPIGPPADHVYSPKEAVERLREQGFEPLAQRAFPYQYAVVARKCASP